MDMGVMAMKGYSTVMWYATEREGEVNSLTLLLFKSIGTKTDH